MLSKMLNNKMLKNVRNLVEALVLEGWHSLKDGMVIEKNKCFIFFDELKEPTESFQYSCSAEIMSDSVNGIILPSIESIPKASWHAEYEGVVISFGKIPSIFSNTLNDMKQNDKNTAVEFINSLNELALTAENIASMSPAQCSANTINVITPKFTEISSLDEMGEMTVLYRGEDKPYVSLKKIENGYIAIPIKLEQTTTNHSWVVHPEFIAKNMRPSIFTEDEIQELLQTTGGKLLNVGQYCTKDLEFKWKQGDSINTPQKSITDFLNIELDELQAHYLNIALDNKLNIANLVCYNYDSTTLKWLTKFMLKDYSIDGINTSLSESSLSVLYDIASAGFFINKYTNPDLSVEMIKNLHDQFLAGFSKREELLLEQGYSPASIDAILKIASRGDGIAHVMYKEPSIRLYLRDYAFRTNQHILVDHLLQNGVIEDNVIAASYDGMPPHVKEELHKFIDCVGDTEVQGESWRDFCGMNAIKKVIFREDLKFMVVTEKGYIKRGYNYISFKPDLITTAVCITCINGQVIVED